MRTRPAPRANTFRTALRTSLAPLAAAAALAVAGCSDKGTDPTGGDDGGGEQTPVSFTADIQPIFDASCVGCHGAGGNGGLDLRAGSSHADLVGVASSRYGITRVIAGDADGSLLYRKMSGAGSVGTVMPPTGPLPGTTLELVRRWIDGGAADD